MYFISENFYLNNISNKAMGVDLVTFDDEDMFKSISVVYNESVSLGKNTSNFPVYLKEDKNETEEVVLNMMLVDSDGAPRVWDETSFSDVVNWLVTDNFVPFVSEDDETATYYFKTIKIEKKFTLHGTGYLEVTFKPFSNYCYFKLKRKITTGKVVIDNVTNVEATCYPIIKTSGNLTISNTSIEGSEPFEITTSEMTTIDMLTCEVYTESKKNLLSSCNRKWLKLKQGKNVLQVTGDAEIICDFPIIK